MNKKEIALKHIIDQKEFPIDYFKNFVKKYGIFNIRKSDLDLILKSHGVDVFNVVAFGELYHLISEHEINCTMEGWTKKIGLLTIAIAIMTAIMMLLSFCDKI